MATPGDLCLLQDLKLYMGGANPVDISNDALLERLISSASAFIARYVDRDLLSLGGQGYSNITSIGSDSGGAFLTLSPLLPSVPAQGVTVMDLTSNAVTNVVSPSGTMNTTGTLYVASVSSLSAGDPVAISLFTSYSETHDGSGKVSQWLKEWPIRQLISVVDLSSGQPYPLNAIVADAELPRVTFATPLSGAPQLAILPSGFVLGNIFSPGLQNLQVIYAAGYSSPPPDLAQAACELALLWFRNRDRIGVSAEAMLGTHVSFFNTSDLLPQTRIKLDLYKRTIRGY